MKTRPVHFYSDGLRLAGVLQLPDDYVEGEKRPAMMVCHGRVAIKEWVPSRWSPHFVAAGYICLIFDYRNLGESEGKLGTIIPQDEVRDVLHALTFLQQQPEVDPDRIGIFGWGLGGGVVTCAAARDERLKLVVCASGVQNGAKYGRINFTDAEWEERQKLIAQDRIRRVLTGQSETLPREELTGERRRGKLEKANQQGWRDSLASAVGAERASDPTKLGIPERITLESMEALYTFIPEDEVHRISPRPIMIAHAEADHEFPYEHAKSMFDKAGEPKTLLTIKNAGHLDWIDPAHPMQKVYVPQVVNWVKSRMPPVATR